MERLTADKPVSEMTMTELAHNNCFVKDGETFYRYYEGEMSARDMARELAKMCGYELPDNDEEFDCEIMDDLYVTENVTERNLIALFYRNLWAQAELYEYLKKYEDTGITPEKIREIDKLYEEKCRELAEDRKKHEWIPCSERLPEMHREDMEAEGEYYMISNPVLATDGNKIYVAEYEEDDGYIYGWHSLDGEDYENIIAWMSLPEPYTERSNK